jgi:hypothetical protein
MPGMTLTIPEVVDLILEYRKKNPKVQVYDAVKHVWLDTSHSVEVSTRDRVRLEMAYLAHLVDNHKATKK